MPKIWCPGAESNHRHEDFQSTALPLSYPGTGKPDDPGFGLRRSMRGRGGCPERFFEFLERCVRSPSGNAEGCAARQDVCNFMASQATIVHRVGSFADKGDMHTWACEARAGTLLTTMLYGGDFGRKAALMTRQRQEAHVA